MYLAPKLNAENTIPSSMMLITHSEVTKHHKDKAELLFYEVLTCTLARGVDLYHTRYLLDKTNLGYKPNLYMEIARLLRISFRASVHYQEIPRYFFCTLQEAKANTQTSYIDYVFEKHREKVADEKRVPDDTIVKQYYNITISYLGYCYDPNVNPWPFEHESFLYLNSNPSIRLPGFAEIDFQNLPTTENQLMVGSLLHANIPEQESRLEKVNYEILRSSKFPSLEICLLRLSSFSYMIQLYKQRLAYLNKEPELVHGRVINSPFIYY